MITKRTPIRALAVRSASHADYVALNRFENQIRAEYLPDDPPVPLEEEVQALQNIPAFVDVHKWVVWDPGDANIVARATGYILHRETNQHVMDVEIAVLPAFRQQGLAKSLLPPLVELAQREQRRLWIGGSIDRVHAGTAFMQRLGARQGLTLTVNQLVVDDVDRQLLVQWRSPVPGFAMGMWVGPYPDDQLDQIVRLHEEVANGMPHDALEIEDHRFTKQQLRQDEQYHFATGSERWTLYLMEEASRRLAGFTEVMWNQNRPTILRQHFTGISPEFRNRGLGRWLKAAMLAKVLEARPQVKFVRTGNADSNAAMLRINHDLGFRPYFSQVVWQIETQEVASYLGHLTQSRRTQEAT